MCAVAFECVWYIVVSWSSRIISALLSSRQDGAFHSQIVSLTLQYWSCEGEAPTTPQTPDTKREFKCQIQTLRRGKAQIVSLRFQYRCGVRWDGAVGDRGDCLHLDKVAEDWCHTSPKSKVFRKQPEEKVFWFLWYQIQLISTMVAYSTNINWGIVSTLIKWPRIGGTPRHSQKFSGPSSFYLVFISFENWKYSTIFPQTPTRGLAFLHHQ